MMGEYDGVNVQLGEEKSCKYLYSKYKSLLIFFVSIVLCFILALFFSVSYEDNKQIPQKETFPLLTESDKTMMSKSINVSQTNSALVDTAAGKLNDTNQADPNIPEMKPFTMDEANPILPIIEVNPQKAPNGWIKYSNDDAEFTFYYPQIYDLSESFNIETRDKFPSEGKPIVNVCIEYLGEDLELSGKYMRVCRALMFQDTEMVVPRRWGGFSVPNSRKVLKIDNIISRSDLTLSQFEICDVEFSPGIGFNKGKYHIEISISTNDDDIVLENPNYFTTVPESCGSKPAWDWENDGEAKFYTDLIEGNVSKNIVDIYRNFDILLGTLKIN